MLRLFNNTVLKACVGVVKLIPRPFSSPFVFSAFLQAFSPAHYSLCGLVSAATVSAAFELDFHPGSALSITST